MAELTPRQREVVRLVAYGNSNKQIADKLGISVKTVKAHIGQAAVRVPGDSNRPRHRLTFFLLDEEDRKAA